MAFSGNFMCTSFKQELLTGSHNFTNSSGDTFKLALYDNNASFMRLLQITLHLTKWVTLGRTARVEEHLTNVTPTTSGTTALTDFADKTYTSATITARGALIYNTTTGGRIRNYRYSRGIRLWVKQVFYFWRLSDCVSNG